MVTTLEARTQSRRLASWALFAMAAYLAVFYLPFLFPPSVFCLSASYSAGFNNKVASIAAVLFGVGAFAMARKVTIQAKRLDIGTHWRVPFKVLTGVLVVYTCVIFGLSACVYAYPHDYGESAPFLDRLDQIALFGGTPFRDFEFLYGPLLLYVPTAIHWLGQPLQLSLEWSYYFSLILLSLIGVCALFWLVNEIIPGGTYKLVAFVYLALIGLNPTMGLNYMYFRYLGPYVALLIAERFDTVWKTFVFLAAAGMLLFGTSPEIGLAFSAGASLFCLCRGLHLGFDWLWCVIAAWLGPALLLLIFGPKYLSSFMEMANGGFNFVVVPAPHILLFLIALIFVVPVSMARLRSSYWREHPGLIGMVLSSVVLVPAALGRCDVGHVFWEGFGILLLSIGLAHEYGPLARRLWLSLVCIVFFAGALAGLRLYARPLVSVAGAGVRAYAPSAMRLVQQLTPARLRDALADLGPERIRGEELFAGVGGTPVAMPLGVDKSMRRLLQKAHLYSRSAFAGLVDIFDPKTEDLKIEDTDKQEWALIPAADIALHTEDLNFVRRVFFLPIRYRYLRAPYVPGKRLLAHLNSRWTKREIIGGFQLYENTGLRSHGIQTP